MILVHVYGLSLNNLGFVLFLNPEKNSNTKRPNKILPIFLGPLEINFITSAIYNQKKERPSTHELLWHSFRKTGHNIDKICIYKFIDKILYAGIYLKKNNSKSVVKIDARPSDAITLALYSKSNIYVSKPIFEKLSLPIDRFNTKSNIDVFFSDKNKEHSISLPPSIPQENANESIFQKAISDSMISDTLSNNNVYFRTKKQILQKMIDTAVRQEEYERAAQLKIGLDKLEN